MSLSFDFSSRDSRNLNTLKQIVPNVINIIESVPHVAIYKFEPKEMKWIRFNVEGAGFVIQNKSTPFYQLIVLNKEFPEDFILDLVMINKVKVQIPYLMIRYSTGQAPIILGFWFHDDIERDKMMVAIERSMELGRRLGDIPSVNESPARVPTQQQVQQQNLMNSLTSSSFSDPSKVSNSNSASNSTSVKAAPGRSTATDNLALSLKSQLGIGQTGNDTHLPISNISNTVKPAHESTLALKSFLLTPASARSQITNDSSLFPTDQEISNSRQQQGLPVLGPTTNKTSSTTPASTTASVPTATSSKSLKANIEPKVAKKAPKSTLSSVTLLKEALAVSKAKDTTPSITTSVASASSTVSSTSNKTSSDATMSLRTILQRPTPGLPAPLSARSIDVSVSSTQATSEENGKTRVRAKKVTTETASKSVIVKSSNSVQTSMMYVPSSVPVKVHLPPVNSSETIAISTASAKNKVVSQLDPVTASSIVSTPSADSVQVSSQSSKSLLSLLTGASSSVAVASSSSTSVTASTPKEPVATPTASAKASAVSDNILTPSGKSTASGVATMSTPATTIAPVSSSVSDLMSPSDLMRLRSKLK